MGERCPVCKRERLIEERVCRRCKHHAGLGRRILAVLLLDAALLGVNYAFLLDGFLPGRSIVGSGFLPLGTCIRVAALGVAAEIAIGVARSWRAGPREPT